VAFAAVVTGHSGASAADFHGLPYWSQVHGTPVTLFILAPAWMDVKKNRFSFGKNEKTFRPPLGGKSRRPAIRPVWIAHKSDTDQCS
jgi:hypothetical protein